MLESEGENGDDNLLDLCEDLLGSFDGIDDLQVAVRKKAEARQMED